MTAQNVNSTNVRLRTISFLLRTTAALSPALAARVLERLFVATRRFDAPERERRWLESMAPASFTSRGRELVAWSVGRGPTVLLAHGWEGRGSQMGAFIAPLRSAGFRVVTFDSPGHGDSLGRQSSLVEMADAVADAASAFGPVHAVIAHSAGAAATAVALSNRLELERAVFVAPPADLGGFLVKVTRKLGLEDEVALLARRRLEAKFQVDWDTLRAETLAPAMTTPLLVIHDHGDREVRFDNATRLTDAWPGSRLMRTDGLGHQRVLRDEDVIAKAVAFVLGDDAETSSNVHASRVAVSPASC